MLFDYGGTLDADGTTWRERLYSLHEEMITNIPRECFDRAFHDSDDNLPIRHRLRGLDLEQTVRLQTRDLLAATSPDRLDQAGPIAGRFATDSRRQFAKLRPTLERLGRRYRLGVVSNFYGNLDGIFRAEGLRDLFVVIADSGALGVTKPESGIFLHAAKAADTEAADCVMVGDSMTRDVAGAAGVGMKTAWISTKPSNRGGPPPHWTIRSVTELEALL